jgi:twitching motility protein PilT
MEGLMFDVDDCLRHLIQVEGSDLHLKVPLAPTVRVHGRLAPIEGQEGLKPDDTNDALRKMLSDSARYDEFDREGEVDFAYAIPGLARFRVNAFRQRGSISLVCRAIPFSIRCPR